jgi:hypothetical protein
MPRPRCRHRSARSDMISAMTLTTHHPEGEETTRATDMLAIRFVAKAAEVEFGLRLGRRFTLKVIGSASFGTVDVVADRKSLSSLAGRRCWRSRRRN